MPVKTPQIEVNPYTSNVPTADVPPPDFGGVMPAPPLQGQFGGHHGSGGMAIGDSILKGFLAGHEYKAQKKAAEAKATLAAADAASNAAYQNYQTALSSASGNVNDPAAKAAYQAYTDTFNKGKEAKAAFVIPEKPKKGEKKKDGQGGALGGIKEFMSANPHLVPQLALMTMQPQPPGLSPEGKQQQLKMQAEQQNIAAGEAEAADVKRRQDAQKVEDQYSGLSGEEKAKLPLDVQHQIASAHNVLFPQARTGPLKLYKMPDGSTAWLHPDSNLPEGAQPVVNTPGGASGGAKGLGSLSDYLARYAKQNGITNEQLTTQDIDYVKAQLAYDTARNTSTSTTVTPGLDSTTTTSSRSKGGAPVAPRGRAGFGGEQQAPRGGMTPLPVAASSGGSARRGGMTRPPAASPGGGTVSPTRARLTLQVNNEKTTRYQKAQDAREKAYAKAAKDHADDPEALEKAKREADAAFSAASKSIEDWYNGQVRAVGGTPGGGGAQKKDAGPVKYYQGHAYQQDANTKEWRLVAGAAQ